MFNWLIQIFKPKSKWKVFLKQLDSKDVETFNNVLEHLQDYKEFKTNVINNKYYFIDVIDPLMDGLKVMVNRNPDVVFVYDKSIEDKYQRLSVYTNGYSTIDLIDVMTYFFPKCLHNYDKPGLYKTNKEEWLYRNFLNRLEDIILRPFDITKKIDPGNCSMFDVAYYFKACGWEFKDTVYWTLKSNGIHENDLDRWFNYYNEILVDNNHRLNTYTASDIYNDLSNHKWHLVSFDYLQRIPHASLIELTEKLYYYSSFNNDLNRIQTTYHLKLVKSGNRLMILFRYRPKYLKSYTVEEVSLKLTQAINHIIEGTHHV